MKSTTRRLGNAELELPKDNLALRKLKKKPHFSKQTPCINRTMSGANLYDFYLNLFEIDFLKIEIAKPFTF